MRWPPSKAWTSAYEICGLRHFVAINYGGDLTSRWVLLVSVLDGNVCLKVKWDEIKNTSKWKPGWLKLPLREGFRSDCYLPIKNICLHASDDSGLLAGTGLEEIRPWDDSADI